jgi:GT2 family glycosyltransferase
MKLSIIILTWNSRDLCMACLGSLHAAGWLERSEVIVVDNGSVDGTAESIENRFPCVQLVRNSFNRGVAPARNQGIRRASGDAILLLDVDTIVAGGAIEAMLAALLEPNVGIVGPRLTAPDGSIQYTCRRFPTLIGKIGRRVRIPLLEAAVRFEELRQWDHASRRDVDYVIGACQLIRREVLERVGLLDERIFYGPEDVDFCLRAQLGGWLVTYEPMASFQHLERRVTARHGLSILTIRHVWALIYFFLKYRYAFSSRRLHLRIDKARRQTRLEGHLARSA